MGRTRRIRQPDEVRIRSSRFYTNGGVNAFLGSKGALGWNDGQNVVVECERKHFMDYAGLMRINS
jgi:hypothetical protein